MSRTTESKDQPFILPDSQATAAWFGGAIEAGGTVSIGVSSYWKSGARRVKTQPHIEIHSHDQLMLRRLYEVYGGSIKDLFWGKGGYTAAEIVASTLPYTVARREHALAMQNWLNAENIDEKVRIAGELKGRAWQEDSEPESYAELLRNPAFVAGIFDSRGYMQVRTAHTDRDKEDHAQYVHVGSKNIGLLKALESHFGGVVKVVKPAGTIINTGDTSFETQVDTIAWEVLSSKALNFLQFVGPYLQSQLPEGWDYQRSVINEQRTQVLIERILARIRMELDQFEAGDVDRVSTNASLAEAFGIHKSTVSGYLSTRLTREEKRKRRGWAL